MSLLSERSALWGAQNRLRAVRDMSKVLSAQDFPQTGSGTIGQEPDENGDFTTDELDEPLTLPARDVVESSNIDAEHMFLTREKRSDGRWYVTLRPFCVGPLIMPPMPPGWTGNIWSQKEAQIYPEGLDLWLVVDGSFQRFYNGFWYEGHTGAYEIKGVWWEWKDPGFSPPPFDHTAGAFNPPPGEEWNVFTRYIRVGIWDSTPPHTDPSDPLYDPDKIGGYPESNSDYEVNHGHRIIYPEYLYT